MKRKIALSIAFALCIVLVSLMTSDSTVKAEPPQRFVFDTGIIDLDLEGEREVLIMTVATGTGDEAVVQFRQMNYTESSCTEGVCKFAVSSQSQTAPIRLTPGEAASIDFRRCISPICGGFRGMVVSNRRDIKVNVILRNTVTGDVVAVDQPIFSVEEAR